ncbi:MAG: Eco47II family restriction endonuclease [Bacteroidota bacterium]
MAYLSWISDKEFVEAVEQLVAVAKEALVQTEKDFNKNVIDPFSAIFQVAGFGIDYKNWVISEKSRQAQKTMQNQVGVFHQSVLGSVSDWEDLGIGQGVDLVCHSRKIIAEVKNKHNTVTGGKLADQYYSLERLVTPKASQYKGYTSYFVNVIPKKRYIFNTTFEPSDKDKGMKCPKNELIRITDGATFYSMVTGVDNALEELFDCLPQVIEKNVGITFSDDDKTELKKFFGLAYG